MIIDRTVSGDRPFRRRYSYLSLIIIIFIVLGMWSSVLAHNRQKKVVADGFVTQIMSDSILRLGYLEIKTNSSTTCSRYAPMIGEDSHWADALRPSSVQCGRLNLTVGSYVHVRGEWQPNGRLAASEITTGNPPRRIGKAVLWRDWRFEDFFSGGPWRGKLKGGAFLEEPPQIEQTKTGNSFHLWINGFPVEVTKATDLRFVPKGIDQREMVRIGTNNFASQIALFSPIPKGVPLAFPGTDKLVPGVYLSYEATREAGGRLFATKLTIFPLSGAQAWKKDLHALAPQIAHPDYRVHSVGSIRYRYGKAINILPNYAIQAYVRAIGMGLVPSYQKNLASTDPAKINLRIYVVRPFENTQKNKFVQIDGRHPDVIRVGFSRLLSPFVLPTDHSLIDRVVEMPDGVVLVPSTELARLHNEAQLAFVLSAAIQSILQREAYTAETVMNHANGADFIPPKGISFLLTQQCIRQSIRQMYLAGYDIREAPFAWKVARDKAVNNPVIDSEDPDKEIPWYAAYAFSYISQYYRDVDYSELKRGEQEYQQFLQELRKADPEAFASQKSASKQAANAQTSK